MNILIKNKMQTTVKTLRTLGFILVLSICVTTLSKAQSPADDPGIGGPGSPSLGVGGDGSPVVPFDGGMSLMLAASGIGYAAKKIRKIEVNI